MRKQDQRRRLAHDLDNFERHDSQVRIYHELKTYEIICCCNSYIKYCRSLFEEEFMPAEHFGCHFIKEFFHKFENLPNPSKPLFETLDGVKQ